MNPLTNYYLRSGRHKDFVGFAKKDALAHAYLFCGADALTLDAAAELFIAAAVCAGGEAPCTECAPCRKVHSGRSGDITEIRRETDGIKAILRVEEVEEMLRAAYLRGFELPYRFICVAHAEMLGEAAQNKLLKTLEEPNPDTVFLFKAVNAGRLLPTVRSRLRTVNVSPLSVRELKEYLVEQGVPPVKADVCAALSGGNAGRAVQFSDGEAAIGTFNSALDTFLNMNGSKDVLIYAARAAGEKDFPLYLESLRLIIRETQCVLAGAAKLVFSAELREKYAAAGEKYGMEALVQATECINLAERQYAANCGQAAISDHLLFSILEVRSKCRK